MASTRYKKPTSILQRIRPFKFRVKHPNSLLVSAYIYKDHYQCLKFILKQQKISFSQFLREAIATYIFSYYDHKKIELTTPEKAEELLSTPSTSTSTNKDSPPTTQHQL